MYYRLINMLTHTTCEFTRISSTFGSIIILPTIRKTNPRKNDP